MLGMHGDRMGSRMKGPLSRVEWLIAMHRYLGFRSMSLLIVVHRLMRSHSMGWLTAVRRLMEFCSMG